MTASNYGAALSRVLVHEGGWADHPRDPGGATMKGVTQRVYDGWRRRRGVPPRSVRLIETAEVEAIYRVQYWNAIRGDDLPGGLDYCVFDAAVNSGPGQAAKWLQRALEVSADGQIGEATLAALKGRAVTDIIEATCDRRLAMLRGLRTWKTFGAGWSRRVVEVRAAARRMALAPKDRALPPATAPKPDEVAKARATETRLSRTPEGAGGLIAGLGGLSAVIAEQAERLAPLAEFSFLLKYAFAALMLAGVVLTLHGAIQRIRSGEAAAC